MSKTFWNTQPVTTNKCDEDIGFVENITEETIEQLKNTDTLTKHKLNDEFEFKNVACAKTVCVVLNENYVQNSEMMLSYSEQACEKLLNSKTHREEYSLGLFCKNTMVGYVFGKEHEVVIYSKKVKVLSVNFLCLTKQFRNKSLAPVLIEEIKRRAYLNKIYTAVFTGDKNLGFGFTEISYYHNILNVEKLKKLIMLPRFHTENNEIYKMRKDTRLVNNSSVEDFVKIKKILDDQNRLMRIFETFSVENIQNELQTCENFLYTLINEESDSFVSFYIVDTKNIKENYVIKKAILYYWGGSSEILKDAFAFCQSIDVDMFDVLDSNYNEMEIIEKYGFLQGTGSLVYHFFNYKVPVTGRSRINMILY